MRTGPTSDARDDADAYAHLPQHAAHDATHGVTRRGTHVQGTRRWTRVLALGTAVLAAVLLFGPPQRLLTLLTGPASRGPSTPPADSLLAEPSSDPRDIVAGVVIDTRDASAPDGSARLEGSVTQGRWGETPARPPAPGLLIEELRGGWRVEAGNEEAAALAVIAAHAWGDALRRPTGTPTRSDGGRGAGVIVAVEAVERPGAHHAVVTTLVAPDGAAGALHRLAVPVTFGPDGPNVTGLPWQLPAPVAPASSDAVAGTPVSDPELIASARRALDAVGLPGDRLVALEATDGWPFIARLDDEATAHPWLRWHLDRFVVAGLPLARTGSAPP